MGMTSEYKEMMEIQLKKWDEDFDALAAEGKKASGDVRSAYYDRIAELRAGRNEAQKAFMRFGATTEAAGAKMYTEMGSAWESMRLALEKAFSDLRR